MNELSIEEYGDFEMALIRQVQKTLTRFIKQNPEINPYELIILNISAICKIYCSMCITSGLPKDKSDKLFEETYKYILQNKREEED